MENWLTLLFVLLFGAVLISPRFFDKRRAAVYAYQYTITTLGILFFGYWFGKDYVAEKLGGVSRVTIINKLPQPLDFYVLTVQNKGKNLKTLHSGTIRPEHFREENLSLRKADFIALAGYQGEDNLVYYEEFPSKKGENPMVLTAESYRISNNAAADRASRQLAGQLSHLNKDAVYIALCLLLIFMNIVLLLRRRPKLVQPNIT